MSHHNGLPALSEKGLLRPDNCAVALLDIQPQTIINNNGALAKPSRVFDVPTIPTTA